MAVLLCEWWLERASLRVRQCDAPPFWHASAAPWPFWLGGVGMLLRTRDICGLPSWMFRSRSVRGWIIAWGSDTHKQFGRGSNGPPNAVQGTPPHSHLSLFVLHDGFRGFSIPRLTPCRWRPGRILIPIGKTKTTKISKTTKTGVVYFSRCICVAPTPRLSLWLPLEQPRFTAISVVCDGRREPQEARERRPARQRPRTSSTEGARHDVRQQLRQWLQWGPILRHASFGDRCRSLSAARLRGLVEHGHALLGCQDDCPFAASTGRRALHRHPRYEASECEHDRQHHRLLSEVLAGGADFW